LLDCILNENIKNVEIDMVQRSVDIVESAVD